MKHKTLPHLLTFILIIAVSSIVFFNVVDVKEIIKNRIIKLIENKTKFKTEIGSFRFDERELIAQNIKLSKEDEILINLEALKVEYSLFKLINKERIGIKKATIFDPEITYNYRQKESKTASKSFKIPDLTPFFDEIQVYNPKVNYVFKKGKIHIADSLFFDAISVKNSSTRTVLTLSDSINKTVSSSLVLQKGEIISSSLKLNNYFPKTFKIGSYLSLNSAISINAFTNKNELYYEILASNNNLKSRHFTINSEKIRVFGNQKSANLEIEKALYNGQEAKVQADIINPLSLNMTFTGKIDAKYFQPKAIYSKLNGTALVDGTFEGTYTSINYQAEVTSENVNFFGQNIDEIDLDLTGNHKRIDFIINNASYKGNDSYGDGKYLFGKYVDLQVSAVDADLDLGYFSLFGNVKGSLLYEHHGEFKVMGNGNNIIAKNDYFAIDNLTSELILDQNSMSVSFSNENSANGYFLYNWKEKQQDFMIKFKRFNTNAYWLGKENMSEYLPYLSGSFIFRNNKNQQFISSSLRVMDKYFGRMGGKIIGNYLVDKIDDSASFDLKLQNGIYNYQPVTINLSAKGSADSLKTDYFLVNNDIGLSLETNWERDFWYKIGVDAQNVTISNYLKYIMNRYDANQYGGKFSFFGEYDSRKEGSVSGDFSVSKFRNELLRNVDFAGDFFGSSELIYFPNLKIKSRFGDEIDLQGDASLTKNLQFQFNGSANEINLEKFVNEIDIKGNVSANFSFGRNETGFYSKISSGIKDFSIGNFNLSSITLDAIQESKHLILNKLFIQQNKTAKLSASGKLGYNLFSDETVNDSTLIKVNLEGDILKSISDLTDIIDEAKSQTNMKLEIGIKDDQIHINKGSFSLTKGKIKFDSQPQSTDDIKINFGIENSVLKINKFELNQGEGHLYLENALTDSNLDIKLGSLNLGMLKLRSSKSGVLVHIPGYMPNKSLVNLVLKGYDSKNATIVGPIDELKIDGVVDCSNGEAIYPPNTKNILSLLRTNTEEQIDPFSDDFEVESLPFDLNLHLNFKNNLRYVTYPVDLRVSNDSYLKISYSKEDNEWKVPRAEFNVYDGTLEMFGEKFKAKDLHLVMTQFQKDVQIFGIFTKKTSDGTTISIEVYGDKENNVNTLGALQFEIISDNPDDKSQAHILARLRYNRSLEDLSKNEQDIVLREEALTYAGVGLENVFVDPIISPLENTIRNLLNLDSFYVKPGLVQNIFDAYIYDDNNSNNEIEKEYSTRLERDILLNNLFISAGKYVTKDVFLDYELVLKKDELGISNKLYPYQTFALRYDLPNKWKVYYRFDLNPSSVNNSHEIMFAREMRFNLPKWVWRD